VLSFEQIEEIIDAACRARPPRVVWETLPARRKDAAARGLPRGGYIATRLADGKNVKFKKMKAAR